MIIYPSLIFTSSQIYHQKFSKSKSIKMHEFVKVPQCSVHVFQKKNMSDRDQFAQTPTSLLQAFEAEYGAFDFDPCPVNPTFDGLQIEWGTNNYVNPPFNNLKAWLAKSIVEWRKGKSVVFLMPIRIHTAYFLDMILPLFQENLITMHIIRGGVKFQNYEHRAPFGMMFLHFPRGTSDQSPSIPLSECMSNEMPDIE